MKATFKKEFDSSATQEMIVESLLTERKIADKINFLDPPSPLGISLEDIDPAVASSLPIALKKLEEIKKNNEMIVVYTDYDADGITGGSILWETLHLLGFKVMPYVPHRKHEGYGFSEKGINNVKETYNPSLIISVDHGIAAAEKITYAKSIGIPIIITDHHLKSDKNPDDAVAVFHLPQLSVS